jgi:stress-induced morphogen
VAQSGHNKPNAQSLQNDFIGEGEQHYWVHIAIDRFTGEALDKQIELVNE